MNGNLYKIIFKGEVFKGRDPREVKQKIAHIFKLHEETLRKLFSGRTVIIKKQADYNTALKYKKTFQKAGGKLYFKKLQPSKPVYTQPTEKKIHKQPIPQSSGKDLWNLENQETWDRMKKQAREEQVTSQITSQKKSHAQHPEQSYSFDPPEIKFSDFSIGSLIGHNLLFGFLISTIIGIFFAPKIYYNYLIEHVKIKKSQLQFTGNLILISTITVFFISYTSIFLLIYPFCKILSNIHEAIAFFMEPFLLFILLPFPVGCAIVMLIQSLVTHTFINSNPVCLPLYTPGFKGFISYIAKNPSKIYFWGIGGCIGILVPPFLINIIFKEWFTHINIDGYQYQIDDIWGDIISDTLLIIFTFGIYNLFYIKKMFTDKLPSGYWEKIYVNI